MLIHIKYCFREEGAAGKKTKSLHSVLEACMLLLGRNNKQQVQFYM